MSVVCMGELLIDFVSMESGVSVGDASGFHKAPGGAPANVAVAVARLEQGSAFLGQVGNDPFGHFLTDVLRAEGVDVTGLRLTDAARTMLAFVALGEGGERSFQFYRHPSADMLMTPDDVARAVIDAGRIFHFGSITLISSPAREATLAAVEYARDANKLISYDPNLRLALWPDAETARTGMRKGLEYAHIVKISDDDMAFMLLEGESIETLFEQYSQLDLIFLTHGSEGSRAYVRGAGEVARKAGFAVASIDTTGAGDAFVAGSLVNIMAQLDAGKALAEVDYDALLIFANACGALATLNRGGIPGLPTLTQVQNFLSKQ